MLQFKPLKKLSARKILIKSSDRCLFQRDLTSFCRSLLAKSNSPP
jgi:hypothetical protein